MEVHTDNYEISDRIVKEKVKEFMKSDILGMDPPPTVPSIYRVPTELRNGHEKFFVPVSVPIGPLHYNAISPAQELKKWCLRNFISRLNDPEEDSLDLVAGCMSKLASDIRECYRDIEGWEDEVLVKMMLLDGCFILEQFWSLDERYSQGNPFGNKLEAIPFRTLQEDLLKIENQLPYFVLKTLANLAMDKIKLSSEDEDIDRDLIGLALNFFNISKSAKGYADDGNEIRHLLELIMNALFQTVKNSVPISIPTDHENPLAGAKTASELEYYGIQFRAVESKNIADVRFSSSNGELSVPKLNIRESVLWNFLIFETLSCMSRIVSSYVVLMGALVCNDKDVEVLLSSKVLVSQGRDTKSLLAMFADMSATVNTKKNFCFAPLMRDVGDYWDSPGRRLRAGFVKRCYDSRWELLNNVLLGILTLTQTLFSVLGYNPRSPR